MINTTNNPLFDGNPFIRPEDVCKKKIISYRGDRSACEGYRIHFPFAYLSFKHRAEYAISVTGVLDIRQIGVFDIAILQRQYDPKVFAGMMDMKKRGQKVVYEIDDDLLHIPDWNPAKKIIGPKHVQDSIKFFLSNVDAMFVSTEHLRNVYGEYCEHIYVLPNSIPFDKFFAPPRNSAKKVVMWQGSMTHERDFSLMAKGLERLAKDPDVLVKVWGGFKHNDKNKEDLKLQPIFDVPGVYTAPLVPFECFYSMLSQMDGYIGFAPITTVPFNRAKSNLKFLEYTAQGIVTVASNFGPYADTIVDGETGVLVSDNRDWYDKTRWLLDNPDDYNRILQNATAFVREHYDIAKNYILWKNAIDEILTQ